MFQGLSWGFQNTFNYLSMAIIKESRIFSISIVILKEDGKSSWVTNLAEVFRRCLIMTLSVFILFLFDLDSGMLKRKLS